MNTTMIVLAEDHHVVRQGLRLVLSADPNFKIVGEAATGLEAVQIVERLRPDVLVTDLMLPELNGLEVTRMARQRSPNTKVAVLSMHDNEAYVVEALQAGASAYVLKKSTADELVHAIRQVAAGFLYLSPPLNERAIAAYKQKAQETALDPYDKLTLREREVLHLEAEGLTNAEIATRLTISPRTVEMHRANMMRKLHLRNQRDLIRYALKRGIVSIDE